MGLRGVLGLVCTKLANPSAQYIRFEVEDLFGIAPMFRYAAGCDKIAVISDKEMYRVVKPCGFIAHSIGYVRP